MIISKKTVPEGRDERKGSGSTMGVIGSVTGFSQNLSRLKDNFCISFRRVGHSLPALAVLAGVVAIPVFFVSSTSQAESSLDTDAQDLPQEAMADELCRWKKDVAFFSALRDGQKSEQTIVCQPAKKPSAAQATVVAPVAKEQEGLVSVISELTAGYPIESMAGAIAGYDREVAALIVGIAKKESNWGKRVPLDAEGKDCFNYWGWKAAGARGTAMGHGCFGSPEEAVKAVGDRIAELVEKRQTSEPARLTVWKCGSSCATHSKESVEKWVSDVDLYYRKIAKS